MNRIGFIPLEIFNPDSRRWEAPNDNNSEAYAHELQAHEQEMQAANPQGNEENELPLGVLMMEVQGN